MSTAILDAAQHVFEQYGARRANVEDVARAAGISRSTLYRAYPTKDALLDAVLNRQFERFLTELADVASGLPPREAVVECFTRGIALTREIPLLARLAQTEPETILGNGHRSHSARIIATSGFVATILRDAGATMPDDELQIVTELMLRVAYTYLLNPEGLIDMTDEAAVRAFAARYLAALVS